MSFIDEIYEQPDALHRMVSGFDPRPLAPITKKFRNGTLRRVIFTGMGSSYHVVYPALLYLIEHGIEASVFESSELTYYGKIDSQTLLVAVSQSGHSVEVVKLIEGLDRNIPVVGITNNADSLLANRSDALVLLRAGAELTVSTKTYTCTLAALHLVARALCDEPLVPASAALNAQAEQIQANLVSWKEQIAGYAEEILHDTRFFVYLGRGPSKASAMTAALITKESTKIPTEGMVSGQFRHGPMEVMSTGIAVVIFATPGRANALNLKLAQDLAKLPGHVMKLTDSEPIKGVMTVSLPSIATVDEWLAPIAEIIPIQFLAGQLSEKLGHDTSKFVYGSKITTDE